MNFRPQRPNTIAKSLAIGNPADGYYSLVQLKETGGACGSVTDEEIVEGIKLLAETEGIFAETAGGVTIASLRQLVAQGNVAPEELTVAFITGAGFKTVEAVADHLAPPLHVDPTFESFEEAFGALRTPEAVV